MDAPPVVEPTACACTCACEGTTSADGAISVEMLSLIVTMIVAVVGHWANVITDRRKEATVRRLDRIDTQVGSSF